MFDQKVFTVSLDIQVEPGTSRPFITPKFPSLINLFLFRVVDCDPESDEIRLKFSTGDISEMSS